MSHQPPRDRSGPSGHSESRSSERRLTDLVREALVDPNLHTDTRMRLQNEITELLRVAQEPPHHLHRSAGDQRPRPELVDDPAGLLEATLEDPALHTDQRLRLHDQISEMLRRASGGAHTWAHGADTINQART